MKQKLVLLLALSLLVPLHVSGNPGGVGNSLENMQCGGACHGDANQNATSNLQLSLQPSGTVWAGQPTEITAQISGFDTSHDIDQIGIFLLSSTNANNDIPTTDGWSILSDGMGGSNNYIEYASIDSNVLTHSWILRADEVGEKVLYVSVHHGDNSGADAGSPFFGVSQAFEITVEAIPENLQRIDPEYQPPTSREVGESTTLCIETIAASSVAIEWREPSGESYQVETTQNNGCWNAVLPSALLPSTIEWRAILDGEGPQQTTPWFSLTSAEPTWEADETALLLQSIAHFVLFFGVVLLVRKPKRIDDEFKDYMEESL
tara:strand:- start:5026 stop:5982 length:957 start_codon:yes stop_codon:yes gene_type:complete